AQLHGFGLTVAATEQFGLQEVEIGELFRRTERGMVGDVVRGPHEIVEGKDQIPMARMNDPRRDRKILVTMGFARSQLTRGGHLGLASRNRLRTYIMEQVYPDR